MEWPAQSPNLNPFENMWGDIKNSVSEEKLGWNTCFQVPEVATQMRITMVMQLNISSVIKSEVKSSYFPTHSKAQN